MVDDLSRVRAVVFDRGGTLVRERPAEDVLNEILHPLGVPLTRDRLVEAEKASRERWQVFYASRPRGQRWNKEIRRDCMGAALDVLRLPGDRSDLLERLDQYWDAMRSLGLYAGVQPCLTALSSQRVPMGVLGQTLRNSIEIRAELERFGVARHFSHVVASEDTPWDKPDAQLFHHVALLLGFPPEQILYVGDDVKRDIQGAHGAGMKALLIDRKGAMDAIPDEVSTIKALTEVPGLLASARVA